MDRSTMIKIMKDNPGVKFCHGLFSKNEYLYCKEDGKVYTEEGYLFEDWFSEGTYKHNGLRMREGGSWETGWSIIMENNTCSLLSKTNSGKSYLYFNLCRTCQKNRTTSCKYM